MSSKIGLLISLIFYSLFFVLSVDVMCIQYFYSDLDSKSIGVGYDIARLEVISDEDIAHIEERHHVDIIDVSNRHPNFGDVVEYVVLKEYKPMIVSNDVMELKVRRSVVIGYY